MEHLTGYDAIIIGSGASGLTAAVTLAEGGARVMVFDVRKLIFDFTRQNLSFKEI